MTSSGLDTASRAPAHPWALGLLCPGRGLRYTRTSHVEITVATTKLLKNGNSQPARIPAELAYSTWDVELVIERQGDELRIRPAQRRMGNVLGKLARFSPDFMPRGCGENIEGEREAL